MKRFSRPSFKKLSRNEKIHFCISIGIGIVIVILLQLYENTNFGEHTLNKAFDYIIVKEAVESVRSGNIAAQKNKKVAEQIIFFDMGNAYEKRGNPLFTPRDELAKIIEAAFRGGAKVIVLDILLEDRDCCHPEHDRRLRGVFQQMIHRNVPTKIIFPVRLGSDGEIKKNLFKDLIEKHPNFYPAIPYISATVSDRIVRYWVPYEVTKGNDLAPFLWNASFLGAALAHGKEDELRIIGQKIKGQKIPEAHFIKLSDTKEIEISPHREDLYRNRIRFFLIPEKTLSKYPGGNLFELVGNVDEIDYVTFKDKVVIIGNGNPGAGDIHLTPVGSMPGMYIIGNVMNTILLGLQPAHPSKVLNMLIELAIIIIAAYILSRFPPLIIKVLKSVVLISVLSAISYYYFIKTGVLLNFTFAVVGMGFHDMAMSVEKVLIKKKKDGKEEDP
jgi:hypothetical protein